MNKRPEARTFFKSTGLGRFSFQHVLQYEPWLSTLAGEGSLVSRFQITFPQVCVCHRLQLCTATFYSSVFTWLQHNANQLRPHFYLLVDRTIIKPASNTRILLDLASNCTRKDFHQIYMQFVVRTLSLKFSPVCSVTLKIRRIRVLVKHSQRSARSRENH